MLVIIVRSEEPCYLLEKKGEVLGLFVVNVNNIVQSWRGGEVFLKIVETRSPNRG